MRNVSVLLGTMCLAASALAQVTLYQGMCDASGAVGLGQDYFVVGDDEQSTLRVFRIGEPKSVGQLELAKYLGVERPGKKPKETDIEGAARIGDRVYWITSHGRDGKANKEPNRHRFFATAVVEGTTPPALRELGTPPYESLLEKALKDARLVDLKTAEPFAPESEKGLSIEGLAATPEGRLLIGFRNPRPNGAALVLPLENPAAVVDKGADPKFGDLIRLDLGKRGIRSLEWVGDGYLIIGGPHDDKSASFELFTWAGPGHQPKKRDQVAFADLGPEAIFKVDGGKGTYILSDDGGTPVDGGDCKKAASEKQAFRGTWLK